MALQTSTNKSNHRSIPLKEVSNHPEDVNTLSNHQQYHIQEPREFHRLSRRDSYRTFTHKPNSSDTLPSSTDSVYNAKRIGSSESKALLETSRHQGITASSPLPSVPPLAIFTDNSDLDLLPSHSRWPVKQLEPIIERRSRSQVRRCSSLPRLQPSPERRGPKVVRSQASAHSVHLLAHPLALHSIGAPNATRERSCSLNDFDCLPKSDTKTAMSLHQDPLSSSSMDTHRTLGSCLSFPFQPLYAPPYRSPTPPGLPSFGTKEALTYRLTTPSPQNKAVTFLRRLVGRNIHQDEHEPSTSGTPLSPSLGPSTHENTTPAQTARLRKIMGMPHTVQLIPQRSVAPRSRLPPGIRVVASPGPLAQADDGTMVRGRWIRRTSRHGIGQRGLAHHPLTRVAGLHTIDEVIQEIDKACEAADEENRNHQSSRTRSFPKALHESTSNNSFQNIVPQDRGLRKTVANTVESHHGRDFETDSRSVSGSSFRESTHMRLEGPPTYAVLSNENPSHQHDIAGFRDYVEQGEREQVRRSIREHEEDKSCCESCWEGFWWFCCTPTGRMY